MCKIHLWYSKEHVYVENDRQRFFFVIIINNSIFIINNNKIKIILYNNLLYNMILVSRNEGINAY